MRNLTPYLPNHSDYHHPHVLGINDVAPLINVSPSTIRRAVRNGEDLGFPVIKAGRKYVVPRRPLFALLGIKE